jgi:hypothetical protein
VAEYDWTLARLAERGLAGETQVVCPSQIS